MALIEIDYSAKTSIMDGFWNYLIASKKTIYKSNNYINIIRKFHNHIGKPYGAINKEDVQDYLTYLKDFEEFKYDSLIRHLTVIKQFYSYLLVRGETINSPCNGLHIGRY